MTAKTLMVQGTSSSAGKSILVTALCRIMKMDGYKVAPFKAQNMALNSFVTLEGGEIGRSQAVQAIAAGIEPSVCMNPVLLKPQADSVSHLVVMGKSIDVTDAAAYYRQNHKLLPVIREALERLRGEYDIVIIEGAGSPAEINLMDREIANMRIAGLARSPVLLIADIDRGGVFASITGTMQLLPWRQRRLIKGFVINKFRGDVSLLKPGLEFLERRYSRPVLGVIPYIRNIRIAQEDSVYLDERGNPDRPSRPDICIIRLPHIACYDDFDPLEYSCSVRYVSSLHELGRPDLIILPGTKGTISDMNFLHRSGLAAEIIKRALEGLPVIGICGGYQMLGLSIRDPLHAESSEEEVAALGLLDIETTYEMEKVTTQVEAAVLSPSGLLAGMADTEAGGYEIHMGRTKLKSGRPAFRVTKSIRNELYEEGAVNQAGNVFGTYLHGLFNKAGFTRQLLANLCRLHGLPPVEHCPPPGQEAYDELASQIRQHLDIDKVYEIMAGGINGRA